MAFFGIFDSPQTRQHRSAAMAAAKLREQAARDLLIELQVMVRFFDAAQARHRRAYEAGNVELAGRIVDALAGPHEVMERSSRVAPATQAEVASRQRSASTAAEWERYATFELELRGDFMAMREQVKGYTAALMAINREAGPA